MKTLLIGTTQGERFILLKSIHEVRRFIDTYIEGLGVKLCIGDLSLLSIEAQSVLLKFVEENVSDIIAYASSDNVNPVLMSRFDRIIKDENIKVSKSSFSTFVHHMSEKERVYNVNREFLGVSGDNLMKFIMYKRMTNGMLSRVGDLL